MTPAPAPWQLWDAPGWRDPCSVQEAGAAGSSPGIWECDLKPTFLRHFGAQGLHCAPHSPAPISVSDTGAAWLCLGVSGVFGVLGYLEPRAGLGFGTQFGTRWTQQSTQKGLLAAGFRNGASIPPKYPLFGGSSCLEVPPGRSGSQSWLGCRAHTDAGCPTTEAPAAGAVGSTHPTVLPGRRKGNTEINVQHYHWAEIWLGFPARDAAFPLLPALGAQPGWPGRWGVPARAFR